VFAAAKPTAFAVLSAVLLGALCFVGLAGGASAKQLDPLAPTAPTNVHVITVTAAAVTVAWEASTDNVGVAGYYVWGNGGKVTVPSAVPTTAYVVSGLRCGQSVNVSVAAFDEAGNKSDRSQATVAAAPCADTQPPSVPTGFVQQATTQNAVVLSWTPSTDDRGVVGYGIYRNLVPVTSTAEPTATLSGLSCGTTTAVQINAVDAAGNKSAFATAYVQTSACSDAVAPTTPSHLVVSSHSATGVGLSWTASTDNVGVAGYRVSVAGKSVTTVSQPGATISNLSCGSAYAVSVDAFDAAGNRSAAASTSAATDACSSPASSSPPPSADTTPPSTPSALAASAISQTGLTLTWNASNDDVGVAAYDVYQGATKLATVSSTSSTLGSLTCATAYTFGVVARDAAGNASAAAQITVSTAQCGSSTPPPPPPPAADTSAPSQPSGLAIWTNQTSATLTWTASTDNVGVTGYRVYVNGSTSVNVTQPGATVTGLSCGTDYTFEVDAVDAAGNRSSRASLVGSTAACTDSQAPTTPANVTVSSRTATSIALTWSGSTDNVGVTGYGLYRNGSSTGSTATTSGIFSGLTCNTSYTLGVDAADAAGNRSAKAVVMVSTTACPDTTPPSTPTGLTASSITQSGLTLNWNGSTDNVGVTSYDVRRNGTKVASVSSTTTSQTGLACGTAYTFGVVALDAAGNQSQQATLTVSTSACPTTSPAASGTYFTTDYQNGSFGNPWTTLFSYSSPGWVDVTSTSSGGTADGRVKIVSAPGGSGNAARFELRDSDPGWPSNTSIQKSEVRTMTQETFDKSSISVGDVRWFSTRIYLPYNSTEKFEWAHGGNNPFTDLMDLHPGSGSMWPAFQLGWYPSSSSQWATARVGGGTFSNSSPVEQINLWQLTDSSGNRIMSNYNRWIDIVWGMRFAPDSTGWLEIWVDGQNIYPRKNRPTMWSGDTAEYLKQGLYKQKDATFPETGRSVLYYGTTTIGYSKP
jgi:chitodextrinase